MGWTRAGIPCAVRPVTESQRMAPQGVHPVFYPVFYTVRQSRPDRKIPLSCLAFILSRAYFFLIRTKLVLIMIIIRNVCCLQCLRLIRGKPFMLRLNRLTDYAIVVLGALAYRRGDVMPTAQLATLTGLNQPTVAKVAKLLQAEGLLETRRGASGGYRLLAAPQDISQS